MAGLRGSGLHYNTLAPTLAQNMSPLELAEAVELGDAEAITSATSIAADRAHAVIAALRRSGAIPSIVSCKVNDGVVMQLLDGQEYKNSQHLSIGQRCTVVLPILLSRRGEVLLMDQPEDHLDNAYIASTLVPSLRRRSPEDQYIFTTHNANVPVLGEADQVILMASDGRRAHLAHAGDLDAQQTVEAITSLMEGGREAFQNRAAFYASHPEER